MNKRTTGFLNCHWALQREALRFLTVAPSTFIYLYTGFFSGWRESEGKGGEEKKLWLLKECDKALGWGEVWLLYLFIYSLHSQENEMAGRQRQPSAETVEFSLLEDPIVHISSTAAGRFSDSIYSGSFLPHKYNDTTTETAFIRLLLVGFLCASHIGAFQ